MRHFLIVFDILLFPAFCVVSALSFAECVNCSGCDVLMSCLTNGTANCSSNCTKWNPSECEAFKANALVEVSSIVENATNLYSFAGALVDYANFVYSEVDTVVSNAAAIQSILANEDITSYYDDIIGLVDDIRVTHSSVSSRWDQVFAVNGVGTGLYISNIISHVHGNFSRYLNPVNVMQSILDDLSALAETAADGSSSTSSFVSRLSSLCDSLVFSVESFRQYLYDFAMSTSQIQSQAYDISSSASTLHSSVIPSIDCEPCGSSGDGDDSGGGGVTDFTPIITSINNLSDKLDYYMTRLLNLIQQYYSDYDAASISIPSGSPSLTNYTAIADNWFQRVEYLLYSVAYTSLSNSDAGDTEPEEPENATQFEDVSGQIDESVEGVEENISDTTSTPWQSFKNSLTTLFSRLFSLSPPDNVTLNGQVLLSHGSDGSPGHWSLSLGESVDSSSSWVGSILDYFSAAMRIFWMLLVLGLYGLLVAYYLKFVVKALSLFVKTTANTMST